MYLDLSFVCWIVECHYSCNFFRWNNRLGICTQMRSFMKRLVKWWWWRWWQSRKKGLMRPSQLLSVMQFVASDSLWEEEVVLLRRISCAFTKFVGFSKLEWCVHFWLHSYQGCIMISMIFDISQLQNLKKKNMVWGIHRVQLHFCVLGQICQN